MNLSERLRRVQELRLELAGVDADTKLSEELQLVEAFDKTLVGSTLLLRMVWLDFLIAVGEALRRSR